MPSVFRHVFRPTTQGMDPGDPPDVRVWNLWGKNAQSTSWIKLITEGSPRDVTFETKEDEFSIKFTVKNNGGVVAPGTDSRIRELIIRDGILQTAVDLTKPGEKPKVDFPDWWVILKPGEETDYGQPSGGYGRTLLEFTRSGVPQDFELWVADFAPNGVGVLSYNTKRRIGIHVRKPASLWSFPMMTWFNDLLGGT